LAEYGGEENGLHRQIARLLAAQDAIDIGGGATKEVHPDAFRDHYHFSDGTQVGERQREAFEHSYRCGGL
jgi:hypothetical protein